MLKNVTIYCILTHRFDLDSTCSFPGWKVSHAAALQKEQTLCMQQHCYNRGKLQISQNKPFSGCRRKPRNFNNSCFCDYCHSHLFSDWFIGFVCSHNQSRRVFVSVSYVFSCLLFISLSSSAICQAPSVPHLNGQQKYIVSNCSLVTHHFM